jgi:hypothetical protein
MWSCPFCGRTGQRSKEHVWPQWLRRYPAFAEMNQGYTGQRSEWTEYILEQGLDERYLEVPASSRHVADFLPHVQVSVCRHCNSGWMSRMEIAVEDIRDPMISGEEAVLGPDEQTLLAAWVSKCAYGYISETKPENLPFSTEEYRALMTEKRPAGRALSGWAVRRPHRLLSR